MHGERAGQGGKCGILAEGAAGAAPPGRDTGDSAERGKGAGPVARDRRIGRVAIAVLLGNRFTNGEMLPVDGSGRLV
ncbi:hypothetical protein LGM35_04555 [Burkholderia cenocepacia]|uniref:hypothetical protein n=1 Tax=Burkholderia cenocepacia TaxID=95486 RepID=UPI001CF4B38E|nr:hypothetical protein [Burkholderia cenocepacia]MCA7921743.1 hypothetical protein [Burkholderia cenocepacia]